MMLLCERCLESVIQPLVVIVQYVQEKAFPKKFPVDKPLMSCLQGQDTQIHLPLYFNDNFLPYLFIGLPLV